MSRAVQSRPRIPPLALDVASDVNRRRRERGARTALGRAGRGKGPVIVGPWISEVGFEVLYWIPMLRWLVERRKLSPRRLFAVSRGGAAPWYADLCDHYVEIFDVLSPEELKERNERRVHETGGQKHMAVTSLDDEILRRLAGRIPDGAQILHPSLMYNAFRYFWSWRTPPKAVLRNLRFGPLSGGRDAAVDAALPEEYVAVKAYFSSCFPATDDNRKFLVDLVARLAATTNVVLLSTGLNVDDHLEPEIRSGGRVLSAQPWMTPQSNLAVQTQIINGARALLTTYGGFSYLGPFVGVPSICFFSDANYNPTHLEIMRQAVTSMDAPSFVALHTRDLAVFDAVLGSALEARAA